MSLRDACNPFWMAKQAALSLQGRETHQIGVLKGLVNILRKGMLAFCKLINIPLLTRQINRTHLTAYTPFALPSACAFHRATMLILLHEALPCRISPSQRSACTSAHPQQSSFQETRTTPISSPSVASRIWPAHTLPLLGHDKYYWLLTLVLADETSVRSSKLS